jgi:hypothetical protein
VNQHPPHEEPPAETAADGPARWAGEEGWRAAEDWLIERLSGLGWWEAAAWAAGHERTRPRLTTIALQAYATQAAGETKQAHLEQASKRLAQRARQALWSNPALGPPAGVDPDSVAEVEEAAIGVVTDALTATVLADELDRGVVPARRHEQLLQAVARTGLPGFETSSDGPDDDAGGTMPG